MGVKVLDVFFWIFFVGFILIRTVPGTAFRASAGRGAEVIAAMDAHPRPLAQEPAGGRPFDDQRSQDYAKRADDYRKDQGGVAFHSEYEMAYGHADGEGPNIEVEIASWVPLMQLGDNFSPKVYTVIGHTHSLVF